MTEHAQRTIERTCDVAVLDGSASGLDAALVLARARRSVIVVGADTATDGRLVDELHRHGTELLTDRVAHVDRDGDRGHVTLAGGHTIVARRLLDAGTVAGAAAIEDDLRAEDAVAGPRSANEQEWDARYSGAQVWSGNPNGTLVDEVEGMRPGRVLDVGAGEGGDALWLAERGWTVTATDVSGRALAGIGAEAERRGLAIECLRADANDLGAFGSDAFDLVSVQYPSMPRTPEDRAISNLLAAVAPGGTLLVVGHDLDGHDADGHDADGHDTGHHGADDDAEDHGHGMSMPYDRHAYVGVDDIAAAVGDDPAWQVETHEVRDRPAGAVSTHHVADVVYRARRRG